MARGRLVVVVLAQQRSLDAGFELEPRSRPSAAIDRVVAAGVGLGRAASVGPSARTQTSSSGAPLGPVTVPVIQPPVASAALIPAVGRAVDHRDQVRRIDVGLVVVVLADQIVPVPQAREADGVVVGRAQVRRSNSCRRRPSWSPRAPPRWPTTRSRTPPRPGRRPPLSSCRRSSRRRRPRRPWRRTSTSAAEITHTRPSQSQAGAAPWRSSTALIAVNRPLAA